MSDDEVKRAIERIGLKLDENTTAITGMDKTVALVKADVGYLKGRVDKVEAEEAESAKAKNARRFTVIMAFVSAVFGAIVAAAATYLNGGGNAS